jgi:hypothetical protein
MLIQKKNTHNSIYIDIYNKQIQDVHIIPYFSCEKVIYFKTIFFSNQLSKQLSIYFQIQIEFNSTSYICTSCLHNIIVNIPPLYQIPNNFFKNKIVPLVQK